MSGAVSPAAAQPSGGTVVSGQAGITGTGNSTVINQSTQKAIINWQEFSVAAGGTVQFTQPDAASITLNRVLGTGVSAIDGTVTATGNVWILNRNGVLFGQGAQVNVGGLLATTADIADSDFIAGQYRLGGGAPGARVVNDGVIHAADGGSVVLSAASVSNRGLIQASAGSVVLGGATAFTVDFTGDNLLRYAIAQDESGSGPRTVSNSGKISASGGTVLLTARAAANVLDGVINNTGIIEATSAREVNGQIILDAGGGTVTAGGTLDASGKGAGETGGSVEVLGAEVAVADGASIDVSGDAGGGEALIGGAFRGQGPQDNAETTTVGTAVITADAVTNGDGGQVVVWSDGKTRFGGAVSARGGTLSGNGGQVETSGAQLGIDAGAEVITTAPAGMAGNWLLDPDDLLIADSGSEDTTLTGGVLAFGDTGTTIFTDTIEAALLNGNVTLQANNDITVEGSVNVESSNTLELDAGRSILFTDGSLKNQGIGGRIVLSANDPGANAAKREAGAGVITMDSSNAIVADEIDLIVGFNTDGGGIGTIDAPIDVDGDVYIQTAGYDAFVKSYGLNLGNTGHVDAVDLTGDGTTGNLTVTMTGLTQTGAITVKDLTIAVVGDVPETDPISLTDTGNAISGKLTATAYGGEFGGPNQIEITNSQALVLGDIRVEAGLEGQFGSIEIVTTDGGITIESAVTGGWVRLEAVGDIVETQDGLITSFGDDATATAGRLEVVSTGGIVSLPNANSIVPKIVCVDPGCSPTPQEMLIAGSLTVQSAGDATINLISPVELHGVDSGGSFKLTVFGDYNLSDEFGTPQLVYNAIEIHGPVEAGKFINLSADGDIVQVTDYYEDRHLEAIGLIATSVHGGIYLDNAGNGSTDPGNRVGGDINGYVLLNSAGDTRFTNTVNTILGGPAYYPLDGKGEQIEPTYPFAGTPTLPPEDYDSPISTIGGNLVINIVDIYDIDNDPVLVLAGRIHAENGDGGYSVLHAEGDIANNNGYGTIVVGTDEGEFNNLSLVSDRGTIGGDDGTHWTLGLGADTGALNLHAKAEFGAVVINPGDLNIGIDLLDEGNEPLFPIGVQTNYFLSFGNGFITQNADSTGVIMAGALDVHARDDIVLDNAHNVVTGSVDFYAHEKYDSELDDYVASDITFHNSVDTLLTRATGVSPDGQPDSPPMRAGNVTIIVDDVSGETAPTLTLGNRGFINGQGVAIVSSIGAEGDVYLYADGSISDGYDPDDLGSGETAGFIQANGELTVVADAGDISLANPINAVNGDIDLTAGPTYEVEDPIYSDITFANSVNTTLVRANGGEKFGTYIEYAGDVTILVSDPTGNTNPWLTIGNTSFIDEGENKVNSSINAVGNVILLAGGVVSDGYDPNNGDTWDGAGFVEGETLTVTSAADEIWLQNPGNGFNGLTATTDDKDITITAYAWSSYLEINGIDAGAGNVTLTVNDSDLIQSGTITAKDFAVSTHDTIGCEGICFPILYGVYLDEDNEIGGTIEADVLGGVFLRNTPDTTVGTSSAGRSFIIISDGDLTIAADATIDGGFAGEDDASVLLVTDKAFHNLAGSDAISLEQGERWLVYSDNPDDNTFGGLDSGNTAIWNTVYNGENTLGDSGNRYVFAYQPVITVTSTDVEKTFGDDATAEVAAAYTITGLHEGVEGAFLGDNAENVYSGTPLVTSEGSKSDANVEDSPYTIDVANGSFEVFGGYGVSFASDGLLTVDPLATLYYVADPATRTYGEANPTFTGTVQGFLDGDNQQNSTTGTMVFTSEADEFSGVGSYAITGSGLTSQNYAFAQDADNATALTIDPATLVYTADAKTRTYGAANPALTGTVTGFVNGENQQSATTGTLTFTTDATKTSGVGKYAVDGSGLSADNYVFVQAQTNGKALTVTPATLTYTADKASRTYGDDNPAFDGTVTGFVNSETLETATDGTVVFTSNADASSDVGKYAIDGSGLTADNYVFVQAAGNATALTVDPATLTYTADEASRTYGDDNPAFTGTVTGFVNGDTQALDTTGTLVFSSEADASSDVGEYAIDGSGLSAKNYVFVQAESNATALTIDPAILTYNATLMSRIYGDENPDFDGTVTGFVNGDTQESDTTGTLAFTSDATAASNVGSYAIDGSGLSAQNYVFVQADANATALTVDPATLTYVADAVSRTYGDDNPAFTGTVTGFVNGDTQESDTTGTLAFTSDATASSNVGSYAIDGSGLSAQNYVFVQAEANATALTVDPATLTYVADAAARTYGEDNPAFTGTITGFVNGDTQESATTGTLAFNSEATAASNVGTYAIDGSGLAAQNYVFVQAESNATALTVDPATLTYIADEVTRTYGEDNPAFTGTVTGFVNGDTQQSATTGTLAFNSDATAGSHVGSYAIDGSGLSAQNYVFVQAESNASALTVDPATLTYIADAVTRTYGEDNPAFTGTVTGFVNGDTQESATSGTLAFNADADEFSNVGSYAIDGSGLSAQNYVFVQAESNASALTVDPATLTYIADAASRTYGEENPAFTGILTGFVNGDTQQSATAGTMAFTSQATAASNVGSYAIDGSGLSAQNYIFVQAEGNASALTIDPATLTYTANAATRVYGKANPTLGGAVTGFVNGDTQQSATTGTLAFGTSAVSTSNVGKYTITGSGLAAQNYVFVQAASNANAFSITPATLTVTLVGTVAKVFDGTTAATLDAGNYSALSGILFADDVGLAGPPTDGFYDTPDVGTGKTVTVSGLTLTGADAGNYIIATDASGAIGIITPDQPDTGGATGAPLTGVIVTNTQTFNQPPGTVIDALNQASGNQTGGQGAALPPPPPPPPNMPPNPLENLVITSPGGQGGAEPPTTADSVIAYIVDSFDDTPPPGPDDDDPNAVIPNLLTKNSGGSQNGPMNYGSVPGWGNTAFWQ